MHCAALKKRITYKNMAAWRFIMQDAGEEGRSEKESAAHGCAIRHGVVSPVPLRPDVS
jgi:hypothetical protein